MPVEGVDARKKAGKLNPLTLSGLSVRQFKTYCLNNSDIAGIAIRNEDFGLAFKRVRSFFFDLFAANQRPVLRLILEAEDSSSFEEHFSVVIRMKKYSSPDYNALKGPLDSIAYGFIREKYREGYQGYSDEEISRFMGADPGAMTAKLREFMRNYPRRMQK